MNIKSTNRDNVVSKITYTVIAVYVILSVLFNLRFLEGSNINFAIAAHDEYLTVREVYSLLEPLSWKHFFMAIISGDILYYGRLMFYSDAFVSFLPYQLFGLSGLIFAVRMFHALLLLGGVWIIARSVIRSELYRLLFVITSLFAYYSFYFMMLPKPEPHQIFVLALFIRTFLNKNYQPGIYFVYLGLAYGLKFNAILLIPGIAGWIMVNRGVKIREAGLALLFGLTGVLIAVPCLLLAPVKPVFLKSYLSATFLNTTNVDDNQAHGAWEWLSNVWPTYYSFGLPVFLLTVILVIFLFVRYYGRDYKKWINSPAVLMVLMGLSLNLPVVLTTQRLYPHYLWTGQIFIWAGIFCLLAEHQWRERLKLMLGLVVLTAGISYSFRTFNHMLLWEKNAQPLVKEVAREQNKIFSLNPRASIVEDISVYFPFEWHVKAKPYHPFSSSNPSGIPEKNIFWTSFIDTGVLNERKPDYVFMGRSYIAVLDRPQDQADSLLLVKLSADYQKISASRDLVIWKKQ